LPLKAPSSAGESCNLAPGIVAVAPGLAWLPEPRVLIAADAHLAYEDVVGGALPLWSTTEIVATLSLVAVRLGAREIVFLGDIVHGAQMSDGAMRTVRSGLALLRERVVVTLVAGNHEGRTRAFAVLGETVEACVRDGWLLVHGDGPAALGRRAVIGHLHPSLHLGGGASVPAFVACDALVVLPALTPYSPGLDLCSDDFATALGLWSVARRDVHVVAATGERVFPFGARICCRSATSAPTVPVRRPARFRKRHIRPDR
jgi:metallophosphoesterase superfamily enzyme